MHSTAEGTTAHALTGRDDAAFRRLYASHFGRVYSYVLTALRNRDDAQEVTQQVFLQVYEQLDSYEFRGQPVTAWLFRIARNRAIDHIRKHRRTDPEPPSTILRRRDSGIDRAGAPSLAWGSREDVHGLMRRLPVAQQQVIVLSYLYGLSAAEIGAVVGRTPDAVRHLHSRALRCLQARLSVRPLAPATPYPSTGSGTAPPLASRR